MTQLYSDANGNIVRALLHDGDAEMFPDVPTNAVESLEFDGDTNALLVTALSRSTDGWQLTGGKLYRPNGAEVIPNASSGLYTDRQQFEQIRDGLRSYYKLDAPTPAQSVVAIKAIIRVLGIILDYYLARR